MKKLLELKSSGSIVRTPFDGQRFKTADKRSSSLKILSETF
jgi:hypothetical protein